MSLEESGKLTRVVGVDCCSVSCYISLRVLILAYERAFSFVNKSSIQTVFSLVLNDREHEILR